MLIMATSFSGMRARASCSRRESRESLSDSKFEVTKHQLYVMKGLWVGYVALD